ncbi:MAG: Ig-like domain-containing protein, partial [Acidimicrobiia bacterium]|nr:Ig-like domain-containing protein [Acidimicrobiia bacterium]
IDGDGWFDLVPGAGGEASQPDTEGNETFLWWGVNEPQVPTFGVHVQADFVSGGPEWAGPLVTVVAGGETYGVPVNSDGFYLDLTAAHDIVEGDLVTVSDGSYTKEHIVTGIEAHEPDATLDTVGGAASAGHGVYVWIHDSDVYRFVTDSLEWVADFTAAGIGQAEQGYGEFDLVPGTAGGAAEIDDDGDWTQVDWQVNFPPVASDDFYDTDEDSELAGLEVLSNDEDDDGDPLGVDSFNVSGTVGDVALEGSIFEYGPGSWFDYLAPGESATDSWTYVASDGRGGLSQATVTITIDGVNDGPTMEDELGPTVQHSDGILPIVFTAADVDSDAVTFTVTGLPASLTTDESCASDGINGAVCTLTITGTATDALGDHAVIVLASDGDASAAANTTIRIVAEDADVLLHGGNPTAIPVAGGTTSGAFDLTFKVRHTDPDSGFEPTAGDLSLAAPAMVLEPVGPGPGVAGSCDDVGVSGTGYDTQVTVTCSFNSVPGNTYLVTAEVSGYFMGSANGVLVVYDPASGEVEGGGTFLWDGDFAEFGFTMDYNKKGNNLKGSFLLIRHTVDGDFVVKSNVLYGMATGQDGGTSWATFAGKATMTVPNGDTFGNHEFVVGVTDNPDTFWIETRDKARVPVPALSMPRDSEGQPYLSVALLSGDVVVPNGNGGKKK